MTETTTVKVNRDTHLALKEVVIKKQRKGLETNIQSEINEALREYSETELRKLEN